MQHCDLCKGWLDLSVFYQDDHHSLSNKCPLQQHSLYQCYFSKILFFQFLPLCSLVSNINNTIQSLYFRLQSTINISSLESDSLESEMFDAGLARRVLQNWQCIDVYRILIYNAMFAIMQIFRYFVVRLTNFLCW